MRKRLIQVPIDETLLKELNTLAKKQGKARSEIIREACARYIVEIEQDELDEEYVKGYRDIPEGSELGETGLRLLSDMSREENW